MVHRKIVVVSELLFSIQKLRITQALQNQQGNDIVFFSTERDSASGIIVVRPSGFRLALVLSNRSSESK